MSVSTGRENSSIRVLACCAGMVMVAGLERMTFEVLGVLREHGASVHCVLNNWENYRIVPLVEQIGATWSGRYYPIRLSRHTRNPIKLVQMSWILLRTSIELLRDARRFRPTHLLLPELVCVLYLAPAVMLLRLLGVRVIMRLGNPPDPEPFYQNVWRWVANPLVECFVCNSKFTQQELLTLGIPASKVSYIYNTIPARADSRTDGIMRDTGKVIYIGQIIPSKGVDFLLDAIGILVERGLDVRLDVVGQMDGWMPQSYEGHRKALSERAEQADLRGRVTFLGWREDVPAVFAAGAIHCCPSRPEQREAFGVVNIEAKKAGIPSVVTPTGALPELITHRVDGWISSDVSAKSLAEGIEYFFVDAKRRDEAGRSAQLSLQRFSRESFAEQWWNVFAHPAIAKSQSDGSDASRLSDPESLNTKLIPSNPNEQLTSR